MITDARPQSPATLRPIGVPDRMTVIRARAAGGPEVLVSDVAPVPKPGPRELLIEIWAAGVNRPDVLQREGRYPPPAGATDVLGLEVMGRVVDVGSRTRRFGYDERVMALVVGGGYAEYVAVPEGQCLPIPATLTAIEAAGLPESLFTVWFNLGIRAHLKSREWILIHGGGGAIGTMAVALSAALGCHVVTTTGSANKAVPLRSIGATEVIQYTRSDFWVVLQHLCATHGGFDVILDTIGGPYFEKNLGLLAPDGRLVQIAFRQGSSLQVDLAPFLHKRLTFMGSTLRAQKPIAKARIARSIERCVFPQIEAGILRPVVDSIFLLEAAGRAHVRIDDPEHFGKIILVTKKGEGQGLHPVPPATHGR
ncbi:MAG: NAD(P)H-quinone oxidoreductase [Gammaproteobacteria bacterium]